MTGFVVGINRARQVRSLEIARKYLKVSKHNKEKIYILPPEYELNCLFMRIIAKSANKAAAKVETTITNLLSYMSDIFPTGNCETAPETANKNVTIDISKIVKFIEVA